MTDTPAPPSTQASLPSQTVLPAPVDTVVKDDPAIAPTVEQTEEEPYTIKCICNFSDDDGNTIYCETCDTWQHIDCFYPNNREEAIREDFAHSCAECKPRPLDRQKAIERTLRLRNVNSILEIQKEPLDKKTKRPPTKTARKKPKPNDLQLNGHPENGPPSSSKKTKSSHRPSHSVSSQPSKRSPSYGQNSRSNPAQPPSPATTPPDLPNDFQIHHYSAGFYSLYNEQEVPDTHNNAFASLAIPTALSRWLRDPDTMKQEVGRTRAEVFQDEPPNVDQMKPKLEVNDTTRLVEPGTTLRWRCIESTTAVEKDVALIELNGEIGFQKDYCADPANVWADLSCPLPFVFFHPSLPLYIDTRKEGSLARYVRRSCKPNAQLDTYLSGGSEYHFWLVSDRYIPANEQITLPWDFRLEKSVRDRWLHLLGLSDDDSAAQDEPELDSAEYTAISNWIDRILSEYGGCACDLENNCAFARFHRQYLFGRNQMKGGKKKPRKARNHTISPTSTGQATNSRAASEGNIDEGADDVKLEGTSRSKPPSRDRTPVGSFDQLGILTEPTDRDKRKVAMVEDSFRRMEQQQPPRKKKRVSDGTTPSSKSKSRNGSTGPPGQYVDAGTSRSKSGSPASGRSPSIGYPKAPSKQCSSTSDSRQTSAGPRGMYRDATVQTDPVEGHWISESCNPTPIRKRIISLSKRLMNSRRRSLLTEEERKRKSLANQISNASAIDLDSPTSSEHRPSIASTGSDVTSPKSHSTDTNTAELSQSSVLNDTTMETGKMKAPDLRVQLPPVPAFDSTGLVTSTTATPLSAASSAALSPFGTSSASNPFAVSSIYGVVATPSPVKKKLSLSDYKSRLNKAAGKAAGGSTVLKPGLAGPEDVKVETTMEPHHLDKPDDSTPTVNGA
ncbi:SET domain protein [Metarhizium album ARSEF 1941]|uniref:SET domain protein n=1 Tax=Metarhizium album (strain ARSEF 1941) TaxID=1081103 RepID=A0A0B2WSV5_METAS|nr:SET domain protein [Metarhizium album ARSEF 1941]KHN96040.1 SET domain protein [Metarhizium album ARSEF 1941]